MKLVVGNQPPTPRDPERVVRDAQEWWTMFQDLKRQGATHEEAAEMMIPALKAILPLPPGRTKAWRYYCETCNDTGQRYTTEEDDVRGTYQIAVPCFCAKGVRIQAARDHAAHERASGSPKRGWAHIGDRDRS